MVQSQLPYGVNDLNPKVDVSVDDRDVVRYYPIVCRNSSGTSPNHNTSPP